LVSCEIQASHDAAPIALEMSPLEGMLIDGWTFSQRLREVEKVDEHLAGSFLYAREGRLTYGRLAAL
jgi:hypothetical protein